MKPCDWPNALEAFPQWRLERIEQRFQGHHVPEQYVCCVYNGKKWSGNYSAPTVHEAVADAILGLQTTVVR